jgi:Protein of unknown function (DUF3606)
MVVLLIFVGVLIMIVCSGVLFAGGAVIEQQGGMRRRCPVPQLTDFLPGRPLLPRGPPGLSKSVHFLKRTKVMADDKEQRDYRDRERINLHEDYELHYWSKGLSRVRRCPIEKCFLSDLPLVHE